MEEHSGTGGNRETYHGVETLPTTFQNGRSPSPGDGEGGSEVRTFNGSFFLFLNLRRVQLKPPTEGLRRTRSRARQVGIRLRVAAALLTLLHLTAYAIQMEEDRAS